jgi:hypothetical protein
MINLRFSLTNPWSDLFDAGWMWGKKITENNAVELQLYRCNAIVEAQFEFTTRQDHAGIRLEVGLLSYVLAFNLYDTRHWNYATRRWEVYDYKDDEL